MDNFFGEVIHVYTDEDAVEDGVLVDITSFALKYRGRPLNRMTGGLMAEYEKQFTEAKGEFKTEWLIELLQIALSAAYKKGDIDQIPPGYWLMENELDGWTLMRPEDY